MSYYLKIAETLTNLLENRFRIFGLKFGIDPLLGLVPWLGDAISALLSCYLVWAAYKMKIPQNIINQMLKNIALDFIMGSIPVIGDVSDFIYKANTRNLELLKKYAGITEEGEVIAAGK